MKTNVPKRPIAIPPNRAQAATEALRAGRIDKDMDYTRFFAVFFYREKWPEKEGWPAVRRAEKENKTTAMKVRLESWKYALRRTVGKGGKSPYRTAVETLCSAFEDCGDRHACTMYGNIGRDAFHVAEGLSAVMIK